MNEKDFSSVLAFQLIRNFPVKFTGNRKAAKYFSAKIL